MLWARKKHPFGIDPAGYIPQREKGITIEVEGDENSIGFRPADEPIFELVAKVIMLRGNADTMITNSPEEGCARFTITGWDPIRRQLKVQLT